MWHPIERRCTLELVKTSKIIGKHSTRRKSQFSWKHENMQKWGLQTMQKSHQKWHQTCEKDHHENHQKKIINKHHQNDQKWHQTWLKNDDKMVKKWDQNDIKKRGFWQGGHKSQSNDEPDRGWVHPAIRGGPPLGRSAPKFKKNHWCSQPVCWP